MTLDGSGTRPVPRFVAGGERLPRSARIRRGSEIRTLLRDGRRLRRGQLEAFVRPGDSPVCRFGTIVPKHGRRIVDRNLLKRRLREIGRRDFLPALHESARSLDVLVRTRPGAYRVDFDALRRDLLEIGEVLCSEDSWSA